MNMSISFHQINGDGHTIDHIDRRLAFALAHFKHAIKSVEITISNVSEYKEDINKQCTLVIKLKRRLPNIIILEKKQDLLLAIDRCISRASQNLTRQLKRKQHFWQDKPSSKTTAFAAQAY